MRAFAGDAQAAAATAASQQQPQAGEPTGARAGGELSEASIFEGEDMAAEHARLTAELGVDVDDVELAAELEALEELTEEELEALPAAEGVEE